MQCSMAHWPMHGKHSMLLHNMQGKAGLRSGGRTLAVGVRNQANI